MAEAEVMDVDVVTESDKSSEQKFLRTFLTDILSNLNENNINSAVISLSNVQIRIIYFELYKSDIALLPKLKVSVLYSCIKTLLRKWKGYFEQIDLNQMYSQLTEYLDRNLKYIDSIYNESVANGLKDDNNVEAKSVIEISCPYRHLKTLVYRNIHPKTRSIINITLPPKNVLQGSTTRTMDLFKDIFNNPYIEVKIVGTNFSISRHNVHKSEYKFIKLTPDYKPKIKRLDTKLRYFRVSNSNVESFPSTFITDFLEQFKSAIRSEKSYSVNKKMDMLSVLTEFTMDFQKCSNEIDVNTEYYLYTSPYPYVRYLGLKDNNEVIIPYENQIEIEENSLNVRLQEIIYPCVKFKLTKFNIYYYLDDKGNNKFEFPRDFVTMIMNKCIIFTCTLCNFETSGQMAKYNMETHIHEEHGEEPNWFCPKCKKEFGMKHLCAQRWTHDCPVFEEKQKKKKNSQNK